VPVEPDPGLVPPPALVVLVWLLEVVVVGTVVVPAVELLVLVLVVLVVAPLFTFATVVVTCESASTAGVLFGTEAATCVPPQPASAAASAVAPARATARREIRLRGRRGVAAALMVRRDPCADRRSGSR
jgi:hypothetical protein